MATVTPNQSSYINISQLSANPSRYDAMYPSPTATDSQDKQSYPDVLSADTYNVSLTQPPYQLEPDNRLANAPFVIMNALLGTPYYEDIVFNLNGIPHLSLIYNYASVNIPVISDVTAIATQTIGTF